MLQNAPDKLHQILSSAVICRNLDPFSFFKTTAEEDVKALEEAFCKMEHQLLKRRTFLGGDVAVGKKAYKRTEQIAFSAKQRKKHNEEHNQVKGNTFQRLGEKSL